MSRSKRLDQGRDVYEFGFRCDSCKREYRFRDGKLKELKTQRDPFTELMAMRKAEIDTIRNRRCPHCGGPLDDWLTCDWCHEQYSIDNGELVPRIEDHLLKQHKPQMREYYALNAQR
jgi:nitrite reductase/ring-hydroxylating ferredoxin subunit